MRQDAKTPGRQDAKERLFLRALVLAAALLASAPSDMWACAVCNDPFDKNRIAFLATTAFLTVLPLSLIGGLLAYLRRRARAHPPPQPPDSAS